MPLTMGGTDNPYQYGGGSIQAQMTIILHELAHDTEAIPRDGSGPNGAAQSLANTKTNLGQLQESD